MSPVRACVFPSVLSAPLRPLAQQREVRREPFQQESVDLAQQLQVLGTDTAPVGECGAAEADQAFGLVQGGAQPGQAGIENRAGTLGQVPETAGVGELELLLAALPELVT